MASIMVGVLSMLFIYVQDFERYGFSQILLTSSFLLAPMASLGMVGTMVKFFPDFQASQKGKGVFLAFCCLVASFGALLLLLVGYFFLLPYLEGLVAEGNNFSLYADYAGYIYLLAFLQLYISILDAYILNFRRITAQTILTNLLPKLMLASIIFFGNRFEWSYDRLAICLIMMNAIVLMGLLTYLWWLKELNFSFAFKEVLRPKNLRSIRSYALYLMLGLIGGKLSLEIDTLSLGAFISEGVAGVYRFLVFAGMIIAIPYRTVGRIVSPIIASGVAKGNWQEVADIYKRSAIVLLFVEVLIFSLILVSIQDLFLLTGKENEFDNGLLTFALIGAGALFNAFNSVNGQIMAYSELYRYNLYLTVALGLSNVYLNWLFIAKWEIGIAGAAAATLLSLAGYNIIRSIIVYVKLGMHPFAIVQIWPLMLGGACISMGLLLPIDFHPILNIVIRSVFILAIFYLYLMNTRSLSEVQEQVVTWQGRAKRFLFGSKGSVP